MGLSHLRFAAGVCVLAAGLLMGAGGAVAVADPDSSGSATNSTDTNQKHSTGAENPKKDGTGHQGREERRLDANGEKTKGEKKDSDLAAAAPKVVTPAPKVVTPAPAVVAPAPKVVTPAPKVVTPAPAVVAPAPKVVTPAPEVVAPAPAVVAPAPKVVTPAPGRGRAGSGRGRAGSQGGDAGS